MNHPDSTADYGSGAIRPIGRSGLVTAVPPHLVPPDGSPDALNVLYSRSAVEKRGGFSQALHQRPRSTAVRNRGQHGRSRAQITAGSADTDYLIVPGYLWAAHHDAYDDAAARDGLTVSCMVTIDDLTTAHGGNADTSGTFGAPPYTVEIRPILSKGPVKRTKDPTTVGPGSTISWSTTSRWGPHGAGEHAMPFCLYLDNVAGTWEFAFAFHHKDSIGDWQLSRINLNGMPVRTGLLYHVQAFYSVSGDAIAIRVGYHTHEGFVYLETSAALTGVGPHTAMPRCTSGPIQVFDCPQEFIDAPAVASATRPPGLGFSTPSYFFAAKRFEGTIEDVAIFRGSEFSPELAQPTKIDPQNPHIPLINYWPGDGEHDLALSERLGRGNHLWKAPAGPITHARPAEPDAPGWVFNGTTSYALAEMTNENPAAGTRGGNPNWRYAPKDPIGAPADPLINGAWQACVVENHAHGLEVAFTPFAVESNFEQVIVEAHAALRLAIGTDGFLRGYCRGSAAFGAVPAYQAAVVSTTRMVPGRRYHVILFRDVGGIALNMIVNGVTEATAVVLASSSTGWPVSGLTVGFGSLQFTSQVTASQFAVDGVTANADQINTDHRSGFCGLIESFRALIGSVPQNYPVTIHKRFEAADYEYRQTGLFRYPRPGAPTVIEPSSFPAAGGASVEPVANIAAGHGFATAQVQIDGRGIVKVQSQVPNGQAYNLASAVTPYAAGGGGVELLNQAYIRTLRAVGAWDLRFDDEIDYAGAYDPGVEMRTLAGFLLSDNRSRMVHVQRSQTIDQMGYLNRLQRRCVESDAMVEVYDGPSGMDGQIYSHRLRPYFSRSPRELAPLWVEGLAQAPAESTPITLLADWTHQLTGERLLIAAAKRAVYWAKGAWRRDSPFPDELTSLSLWFHGRQRDYCHATTASLSGSLYQVDLWCKPLRLDALRVLVIAGGNTVVAGSQRETEVRYGIATDQGRLFVFGVNRSGGGLRYLWAYQEVGVTLRLDEWNHVHVEISTTSVVARVNGISVAMTALAGFDPIATETHVPSTMLWIGGVDAWRCRMQFEVNAGGSADISFEFTNWHGFITEIREKSALSDFTAGVTGLPPASRYTVDGSTVWLYHANDGTWRLEDSGAGTYHAEVGIDELVPIREDLSDSTGAPYDSAVYRDKLYITNGVARPQQVAFTELSQDSPFTVFQVGIDAPGYGNGNPELGFTNGASGRWAGAPTTYYAYVQFGNDEDVVSEASLFLAFTLTAGADYVRLIQLPRSPDPQVTNRRIYLSIGGAQKRYLFWLPDNESRDVELASSLLSSITPIDGNYLPAPRAKFCAVANGALYLGNLEGNDNLFAVSGDEPDYFPTYQQLPLDSEDGKPIIGMAHTLGAVFLFKRDATYKVDFRSAGVAGLDLYVSIVVQGSGAGGGAVVHENAIYGGGNRGVYLFNGAANQLLSEAIDDTYQGLDASDEGLRHQRGAFLWTEGQLWLSVRRQGASYNDRVLVFQDGRWDMLAVPPHSTMVVVVDESTQRGRLLLGTSSGQVLELDQDNVIDGVRDVSHHLGVPTLTGTATGGSTRSLTMAGANFDVAYDGLAGVTVRIFTAAGALLGERTVDSNTGTVLHWLEPLAGVVAGCTFVLGAIDAYWTTPWMAPQKFGAFHRIDHIDLETVPSATALQLDNVMADTSPTTPAFPTAYESRAVTLTNGYFEQPFRLDEVQNQNRGRYHRIRIGTYGIRDGFAVTGIGVRFSQTGNRGRPA